LNVLVTNDDGITAPGLRCLAGIALVHGHAVMVAAPKQEASGTSAALTALTRDGSVLIARTSLPGLDGLPAYAVAASPGYIAVLAALGAFGPVPDLVLSGINRGANAGRAILHSGTVGAALTAANQGARALAVSLDVPTPSMVTGSSGGLTTATIDTIHDDARNWATAADVAGRLLPWLATAPAGTVLNINVPDRPVNALAGIRRATLAPFGQVRMAIAERGNDFIRTTLDEQHARAIPGTDVALLAAGYATVTPVRPLDAAPEIDLPAFVSD
jgi:5'-nucleotidase